MLCFFERKSKKKIERNVLLLILFLFVIILMDWDQSRLTANLLNFVLTLAALLEAVLSRAVFRSCVFTAVMLAASPTSEGFLQTTVTTHQKDGNFVAKLSSSRNSN